MTAPHLLDANALIALLVTDHQRHARAVTWAGAASRLATCPIVEGALVRFLVRTGEHHSTASALLTSLRSSDRWEFWPDSVSYSDVGLEHVIGHRQVTDTYLAALAASRSGRLATFDRALAEALPAQVDLIP